MSRISFSPIEEAVLSMLGDRWWTLEELQRVFYPEFSPDSVRAALAYLRRKSLVQALERQFGTSMFEQTQLGCQILAEFRRERLAQQGPVSTISWPPVKQNV
jgi:hypothetical protein